MKLKKFNRENCRIRMTGKATVRISKVGTFAFNQMAAEKIGFINGMKLNFYQDQEKPFDWYFEKTTDLQGLVLREYKNSYMCSGSEIARMLLDSVGCTSKSMSFQISVSSEQGYFAIITKSGK